MPSFGSHRIPLCAQCFTHSPSARTTNPRPWTDHIRNWQAVAALRLIPCAIWSQRDGDSTERSEVTRVSQAATTGHDRA